MCNTEEGTKITLWGEGGAMVLFIAFLAGFYLGIVFLSILVVARRNASSDPSLKQPIIQPFVKLIR